MVGNWVCLSVRERTVGIYCFITKGVYGICFLDFVCSV